MPFGRAPVLEVDGTMIAGSINILRYLGNKFGEKCSILPVCLDVSGVYDCCNLLECF